MKALIHWASFGPYHLARFRAAREMFSRQGDELVGLATARSSETYAWSAIDGLAGLGVTTVFSQNAYFEIAKSRMWWGVLQALERIRPDVVAVAGYALHDALAALAWCKLRGRRTVLLSESKSDDGKPSKVRWEIKSRLVRQFDSALCGGKPHRDYLLQLGMRPSEVFRGYNAVDNEYFRVEADRHREHPNASSRLPGLETKRPYFLASSRFIARKNLETLISAYSLLRRNCATNCRLIVLGSGPEESRLRDQVSKSSVPDVVFAGFRQSDELPAYYAHATAFVHPAFAEQWGLVVNEAMAAGLPILISNRVGCASDLVQNEINGFTFDPHDAQSIADGMKILLESPSRAQAMGLQSRSIIADWHPSIFAENFHKAARTALSSHHL